MLGVPGTAGVGHCLVFTPSWYVALASMQGSGTETQHRCTPRSICWVSFMKVVTAADLQRSLGMVWSAVYFPWTHHVCV